MIRPIDIRLNAAHPDYPLAEAVTFTGSPSTVLIRGVPPNCGRWAITAVSVAATFPDGSTTTRAAVQSANGVWVATLPATATSGRTANGLRILADGIDENGEAVTGYVLGVADFAVASLAVTPAPQPGETSWQMLYFDAVPSTLRKGDVTKVDGVLKLYNGTAWEAFATPPTLDDAVTRTSANGVKSSGIWSAIWGALSALPTGFSSLYDWCVDQLAGKLSTSGGTMEKGAKITWSNTFPGASTYSISRDGIESNSALPSSNWTKLWSDIAETSKTVPTSRTVNGVALSSNVTLTGADIAVSGTDATKISAALAGKATTADATLVNASDWVCSPAEVGGGPVYIAQDLSGAWYPTDGEGGIGAVKGDAQSLSLSWAADEWYGGVALTATRAALGGYILGSQDGKPLASEAEAEALRAGKANRAANPTAGNLPALTSSGGIVDSQIPAANVATKGEIRYTLPSTMTVISSASSEVVSGETVYYGEATLADRTQNQVLVLVALDELRVTIPPAVSGKVRDFGLIVGVGLGEGTALAAPALVPVAPTGETIAMMNAEGEMPTLADGTATAKGVTVLYFTEVGIGTFLVKGEQIQEVA